MHTIYQHSIHKNSTYWYWWSQPIGIIKRHETYLGKSWWWYRKIPWNISVTGAIILIQLTLLLIDHLNPFKISTFIAHWFLYTHGDTIWTVLVASCTAIQMVLEGPLIHHSEVSRQGFVLAVLPFGSIQTRFYISCTTIWNNPNKVLY